jgi:hypothetical protein
MDQTMTEIQKLEIQVENVDNKVSSILSILRGNDINKEDRGMIGRQFDHERRLARLEKLKDKVLWFFVGLSIPASWGVIDIIQKLIAK